MFALVGAAAAELSPSLQSKLGALLTDVHESGGVDAVNRNPGAKRSARNGNDDTAAPAGGLVGATIQQNTVLSTSLGNIELATAAAGDAGAAAVRFNEVPFIFGVLMRSPASRSAYNHTVATAEPVTVTVLGRNFYSSGATNSMGCYLDFGLNKIWGTYSTSGADPSSTYQCTLPGIPRNLVGTYRTTASVVPTFMKQPMARYSGLNNQSNASMAIDYIASRADLTAEAPEPNDISIWPAAMSILDITPSSTRTTTASEIEANGNWFTFPIVINAGVTTLDNLVTTVSGAPGYNASEITTVEFNDNKKTSDGSVTSVWVQFAAGSDIASKEHTVIVEIVDPLVGIAPINLALTIRIEEVYAGFVVGRKCAGTVGWGCTTSELTTRTCFGGGSENAPKFINNILDNTDSEYENDKVFMAGLPDNAVREGWVQFIFEFGNWHATNANHQFEFRKSEDAAIWSKVNTCRDSNAATPEPLLIPTGGSMRNSDGQTITRLDTSDSGTWLQVTKNWGSWKYISYAHPGGDRALDEIKWWPKGTAPFE